MGFDSEENYLSHTCEKSGYQPTEPENLGEEFEAISNAAIARGNEKSRQKMNGEQRPKLVYQ